MEPDRELPQALAALARYFDAEGLACDYAALAASRERGHLAVCLAGLEGFDPGQVRIGAQMAFWINVHNAGVLRDAPELYISGDEEEMIAFFERPRLKIHGREYSLDDITHGLLRGNVPAHGKLLAPMRHDDPRLAYMPIAFDERLHFALFRGSRSSPAFRVFEGGRLDVELEEAAARYIRRLAKVEPDGSAVTVPRLLHWYAKDFGGESEMLEFVLRRLDEAAAERADRNIGHLKIHYDAFDWTLNRR
jgi:Protein of unknown function, DUF547